jgi:cytochrome b
VLLHMLAILFYKLVRKQSLVRPMIVGDKHLATPVRPARDTSATRLLALIVLVLCAAAVGWLAKLGNAF